ncbi:hypothetical protein VSK93_09910 [Clostridioides difficile]
MDKIYKKYDLRLDNSFGDISFVKEKRTRINRIRYFRRLHE